MNEKSSERVDWTFEKKLGDSALSLFSVGIKSLIYFRDTSEFRMREPKRDSGLAPEGLIGFN